MSIELEVRQIRAETRDVRTLVLAPDTPVRFAHRAGQYMTFDFDGGTRCYTLTSPPSRPELLTISVKRTPGGPVSTWLHERLRVGDRVRAHGPHGAFTLEDHPAAAYLLLSGGSGATPFMAMARTLHDRATDPDIVYLHSARNPQDLLFREELARIARDLPGFTALYQCEADDPLEAWPGFRGRLSAGLLAAAVPDVREREVLVCGPPPYMDAVRKILVELGCDPGRCHEERFTLDETASTAPAGGPAGDASGPFRIEFALSGRTVTCDQGTTLLAAAEAAGVPVPTSCRQGLCGTCKTPLRSGRVDLRHNGGIREREVRAGQTLLCCSRPLSDLVVER
jgi:ferredoxin-NADP reductase